MVVVDASNEFCPGGSNESAEEPVLWRRKGTEQNGGPGGSNESTEEPVLWRRKGTEQNGGAHESHMGRGKEVGSGEAAWESVVVHVRIFSGAPGLCGGGGAVASGVHGGLEAAGARDGGGPTAEPEVKRPRGDVGAGGVHVARVMGLAGDVGAGDAHAPKSEGGPYVEVGGPMQPEGQAWSMMPGRAGPMQLGGRAWPVMSGWAAPMRRSRWAVRRGDRKSPRPDRKSTLPGRGRKMAAPSRRTWGLLARGSTATGPRRRQEGRSRREKVQGAARTRMLRSWEQRERRSGIPLHSGLSCHRQSR